MLYSHHYYSYRPYIKLQKMYHLLNNQIIFQQPYSSLQVRLKNICLIK